MPSPARSERIGASLGWIPVTRHVWMGVLTFHVAGWESPEEHAAKEARQGRGPGGGG